MNYDVTGLVFISFSLFTEYGVSRNCSLSIVHQIPMLIGFPRDLSIFKHYCTTAISILIEFAVQTTEKTFEVSLLECFQIHFLLHCYPSNSKILSKLSLRKVKRDFVLKVLRHTLEETQLNLILDLKLESSSWSIHKISKNSERAANCNAV